MHFTNNNGSGTLPKTVVYTNILGRDDQMPETQRSTTVEHRVLLLEKTIAEQEKTIQFLVARIEELANLIASNPRRRGTGYWEER